MNSNLSPRISCRCHRSFRSFSLCPSLDSSLVLCCCISLYIRCLIDSHTCVSLDRNLVSGVLRAVSHCFSPCALFKLFVFIR
ncbi:unnamed protein product [Moneuplotes crassus]|uniref:Uncharacterized protein n=1 Tax=Euplotes crassus TaxID=5936 RepID=A0AAD1XA63_EUPCR|nr:unnamed protein product [Moneuplotes crassus]